VGLRYDGIIDNVDDYKEEVEHDILDNTLLQDKRIKRLDKILEKIMKDKQYRVNTDSNN
jgi:hypothetical protein